MTLRVLPAHSTCARYPDLPNTLSGFVSCLQNAYSFWLAVREHGKIVRRMCRLTKKYNLTLFTENTRSHVPAISKSSRFNSIPIGSSQVAIRKLTVSLSSSYFSFQMPMSYKIGLDSRLKFPNWHLGLVDCICR